MRSLRNHFIAVGLCLLLPALSSQAQDVGGLSIVAENSDGVATANANVLLYDASYVFIESRTTDDDGATEWQGLTTGTYNLELYFDNQFWRSTTATVTAGETTQTVIGRREPAAHRATRWLCSPEQAKPVFDAGVTPYSAQSKCAD